MKLPFFHFKNIHFVIHGRLEKKVSFSQNKWNNSWKSITFSYKHNEMNENQVSHHWKHYFLVVLSCLIIKIAKVPSLFSHSSIVCFQIEIFSSQWLTGFFLLPERLLYVSFKLIENVKLCLCHRFRQTIYGLILFRYTHAIFFYILNVSFSLTSLGPFQKYYSIRF